jgi:hypothetical protein
MNGFGKESAFRLSIAGFFVVFIAPAAIGHSAECSIAKTNRSCTLTVDRRSPLAPPTIQMYPGETLTVQVKNPYYFERYFMDYQSGQLTLAPDVASSIVNSLLTPLQKESEFHLFYELKIPFDFVVTKDTCTVDNISPKVPRPFRFWRLCAGSVADWKIASLPHPSIGGQSCGLPGPTHPAAPSGLDTGAPRANGATMPGWSLCIPWTRHSTLTRSVVICTRVAASSQAT